MFCFVDDWFLVPADAETRSHTIKNRLPNSDDLQPKPKGHPKCIKEGTCFVLDALAQKIPIKWDKNSIS